MSYTDNIQRELKRAKGVQRYYTKRPGTYRRKTMQVPRLHKIKDSDMAIVRLIAFYCA